MRRDLRVSEIVAQALYADRQLRDCTPPLQSKSLPPRGRSSQRLRNVVLMGMGEPLLNYEASLTALEILSDRAGMAISPKRLTISTVGVIPGIVRLIEEKRPYSLAVSLHAATQDQRVRLVPASRAWPLDDLLSVCREYIAKLQRPIFFEWTLIQGQNDRESDAGQLAALLRGLAAHVNLIPLNPTRGYPGESATWAATRGFQRVLQDAGIPSTVRQRRGIDMQAGCGQLASSSPAI